LPEFELAIHQTRNDETGKYDDDHVVVANSGGPLHAFSAEPTYFLHINAEMLYQHVPESNVPLSRYGSTTFDIPVNGYWGTQAVSSVSRGTLTTISGYRNNAAYIALKDGARQRAPSPTWVAFNVEERTYIRLRYRDLLDHPHEDYYEVPSVGAGVRMADAEGQQVFEKWRAGQRVELSDIKPEQLVAEAASHIVAARPTPPQR
jgi:hypothetical protein